LGVNDYDDNNADLMGFVKQLVRKAESLGKNGVSVIADLGSFYHYHHNSKTADKLVECELPLSQNMRERSSKDFVLIIKLTLKGSQKRENKSYYNTSKGSNGSKLKRYS
jgi:hypothetical protein